MDTRILWQDLRLQKNIMKLALYICRALRRFDPLWISAKFLNEWMLLIFVDKFYNEYSY